MTDSDLHLLESVPSVSDPVPPVDSEPEGDEKVLNALELRFVDGVDGTEIGGVAP